MTTQQQSNRRDRSDTSQQRSESAETEAVGNLLKLAGGLLLGTVFLLRGLRRRSVPGIVMALVGAGVLARTLRGATGRDEIDRDRILNRSQKAEQSLTTAVSRSVTVGKAADELYESWRDPEVFSQVMGHFAEITEIDEDRHQWTVHGPSDVDFAWETRIVEDEPGERIRWETTEDTRIPNSGSVRFRPAADDRGTVITLSIDFEPPDGTLGNTVFEQLEIVPETLVGHALGRFKSLVESGEISTLEGNPSGRGQGDFL